MKSIAKNERGIALLILIPTILLGITLLFGIITFFYYSAKRSELQNAIDISLLSAAQEICSSRDCWTRSREIFLETLKANAPKINFDFVNLDEFDLEGYPKSSWEDELSRLSIERVRFGNDSTVEVMERDWQVQNPGIPAHLAFFGLQVRFETKLDPENVLPFDLMIEVSSVVSAGPIKTTCVAPFAIKACALLSSDGDFNRQQVCDLDKRFGPSNGYCIEGERCENVSEFDYDPLSLNSFNGRYPDTLFPPLTVKYESPEDRACFFATPRNRNLGRDQNLIGLPSDSIIPNESLIQFVVSEGCVPAEIGQSFQVMHEGLSDSTTAELIWEQISNASLGGVSDSNHRPFNEMMDYDQLNINHNIFFDDGATDPTGACLIQANRYPSFGVFKSFRSAFGYWDNFNERSKALPSSEVTCPWGDEQFNSTFWKTVVPVVADRHGAPCKGILDSTEDPLITSESELEIIGFVRVNIFDVGDGSAVFPDNLSNEALQCSRLKIDRQHPQLPFGFKDQNGDPVNTVQVRGRIACDAKIFGGLEQEIPMLIQ